MPEEKDIAERRSRLSPAQRALLQSRLGGESTARSIGPRARRAPQSLIPLQAAGAKPPFFCVHPSHGSVFGYVDLARYLGTDQPFYGLQSPALDGEQQSYHSIEDMATDYIRALRALGPQELYLLGGWSMGGIVAYEMAQQLLRQGEQLGLLALFDVGPEAFGRRLTANDYSLEVNWFIAELGKAFGQHGDISLRDLQALEPDDRVCQVLKQGRALGIIDKAEVAQLELIFDVFKANLQAASTYAPRAYPQKITIFKASGNLASEASPRLESSDLIPGGIEKYAVPGEHFTMLKEPHVRVLAARLKVCLDRFGR